MATIVISDVLVTVGSLLLVLWFLGQIGIPMFAPLAQPLLMGASAMLALWFFGRVFGVGGGAPLFSRPLFSGGPVVA